MMYAADDAAEFDISAKLYKGNYHMVYYDFGSKFNDFHFLHLISMESYSAYCCH